MLIREFLPLMCFVLGLAVAVPTASADRVPLTIVATHPLMAELGREVGGAHVKVIDLMEPGSDPHRWEPRPQDMRKLAQADLVLAAGKGLEPYLSRLKGSLRPETTLLEVGRNLPSLTVGKDAVYACCPQHAPGGVDPHWWQGVEHMQRAAREVAKTLSSMDPANKSDYEKNARAWSARLDDLKTWARVELSRVPSARRKLVTAHNAFAYFAREFGFEVIAVAGLSHEQNNAPQDLARTLATIRRTGVPAIFPEKGASAKQIESLSREANVVIAPPLIADGNAPAPYHTFEAMTRYNVTTIVKALGR